MIKDFFLSNYYFFVTIFTALYSLTFIAFLSQRCQVSSVSRAFFFFLGTVFLWAAKDSLLALLVPYIDAPLLQHIAVALSPLFMLSIFSAFHLLLSIYNTSVPAEKRFAHANTAQSVQAGLLFLIFIGSLWKPDFLYTDFSKSAYDYVYQPGIGLIGIAVIIVCTIVVPALALIVQSRANMGSEAFLIPLGGLLSVAVILPSNILSHNLHIEHLPRLGALSISITCAFAFYGIKRYGTAFSVKQVLEERNKLQMIGDSLNRLAATSNDQVICQNICDYAQEISDSLFVCIVVFNEDYSQYEIRGASNSSQTLEDTVISHLPLAHGSIYPLQGGSVFARQVLDMQPFACRSIQEFFSSQLESALARQLDRESQVRQVISYPIMLEKILKGCIVLFRTSPAANIDLYRLFAAQCSLALKFSTHIQDIEEKRRLQEMLFQSQKMDALGQLAGGMAHDLNNMLAGISGYVDIIRRTYAVKDPKLASYVDTITNATEKASDLISKLLAFARKGKYQLVPVNLHSVISEVIQLLDRTIDKRIQIDQNLLANPPMIMGDPSQIQNALINLAINARDAMPDGGTLTFLTNVSRVQRDDTRYVRYSIKSGDYLILQVQDTGIGMDKETLARIYEPFFTTKGVGKGTGLGLSSVYGCVKNHGGYIHADSSPGKGTQFTVYLPLLRDAHPTMVVPSLVKPTDTEKSVPGKGTIILVDDESIVRQLCHTILSDHGYTVTTFAEANEAVEHYRTNHAQIDLVILDMIMPHMNGSECFSAMLKINPDIKAILATGYAISDRTQKILTKGISGFLQKPFKEATILHMVSEVLKKDIADCRKMPLRG